MFFFNENNCVVGVPLLELSHLLAWRDITWYHWWLFIRCLLANEHLTPVRWTRISKRANSNQKWASPYMNINYSIIFLNWPLHVPSANGPVEGIEFCLELCSLCSFVEPQLSEMIFSPLSSDILKIV